ncbi:hypothetical protein DSO57_1001113 [Entomophthora muscae]|uniref:Uncharacterized protein n=1 Tax=Entomophthora muscae TaxID=34485 RepID=A0ACC2SB05_9FUNG|nr:hypothetical protein DSO57_1001113 [Entomophthora muscae]
MQNHPNQKGLRKAIEVTAPRLCYMYGLDKSRSNSPESHKRKAQKKDPKVKKERDLVLELSEELSRSSLKKKDYYTEVKTEKLIDFPEYLTTEFNIYLDSRGDPDLLAYGKSNRSKVPVYKLSGNGFIVGLSAAWKLNNKGDGQRHLQLFQNTTRQKKTPRYTEFKNITPTIFLQKDRNFKGKALELECSSFIQFEPKIKPEIMEDDSAMDSSETHDSAFRDKIRNYEMRIKQTPYNIDLWLEYISFQAREEDLRGRNRHSTKSIKNEIQISMFERALEINPESEKLLLEYLKCCQQVWSSAQLLSKWDQVLARHPKNLNLWQQYIGYRLTELSAFNVNSVRDIFLHCFSTIGTDTVQSEKNSLKVIDALCRFFRDTGFTEQAIGIYQALIEWTFHRPAEYQHQADLLASFKTFWEKEWPRFGEDGATGWSSYINLGIIPYYVPMSNYRSRESKLSERIDREQQLDMIEQLPINSSLIKDSYHLDPYRVVLFDDVSPFLINLTTEDTQRELINNFIRFAVLPNYGQGSTATSAVNPFLHGDLGLLPCLERFFPRKSAYEACEETISYFHMMYVAAEPPAAQVQEDIYAAPFRHFPHNGENMFMPSFVLGGLNPRFCSPKYYQFACNSMRDISAIALRFKVPTLGPTLVYLSSSSTMDPTNIEAKFKETLQKSPHSLQLYAAYASHFFQDKKYPEGRKIFSTAIAEFWRTPKRFPVHIASMYRLWADLELQKDNISIIKVIAIAYVDKKDAEFTDSHFSYIQEPTPKQLKRAFEVFLNNQVAPNFRPKDPALDPTFDHIHLHAILTYIVKGITACCSVYDKAIALFQANSDCRLSLELLYHRYVSLLQIYIMNGTGFKPAIVRRVLNSALELFPSNTVFLEAYRQLEAKFRFAGRLRSFITKALHQNPTLPLWFFAIFSEINLPPGQGSVYFTRSLFEKALECPTAMGCSSLWALFIMFEVRMKDYGSATNILFRAAHACPYSKNLYILGLKLLHSHLTESQCEELIHIMLENNLRTRILT